MYIYHFTDITDIRMRKNYSDGNRNFYNIVFIFREAFALIDYFLDRVECNDLYLTHISPRKVLWLR